MKRIVPTVMAALFLLVCFLPAASAITAEQCAFFATGGKVSLCHATQSSHEPFIHIRVSTQACINSHVDHPEDFVEVFDQGCEAPACLPAQSPCDATLGCCEGFACENGTCVSTSSCEPLGSPCTTDADCCSGFCEPVEGNFAICTEPD